LLAAFQRKREPSTGRGRGRRRRSRKRRRRGVGICGRPCSAVRFPRSVLPRKDLAARRLGLGTWKSTWKSTPSSFLVMGKKGCIANRRLRPRPRRACMRGMCVPLDVDAPWQILRAINLRTLQFVQYPLPEDLLGQISAATATARASATGKATTCRPLGPYLPCPSACQKQSQ
jgi:hypothetical protein